MTFPCSPQGAHLARRLVASRLRRWGYGTDVPELLVGELVANAVEHTGGGCRSVRGEFRLRVAVEAGAGSAVLLIEVGDGCGEHRPTLQQPAVEAESGRGVLLVDVLADEWGCRAAVAPRGGKTVWCTCVLTPELSGPTALVPTVD